ncbi:MAG: ribonuclease III [Neomegalonema sp.]|nr:ribonuclease III [Neomegalonema sp.]
MSKRPRAQARVHTPRLDNADFVAVETVIGYRFQDRALLAEALTHVSAGGEARPNNQRLEFLGDRVLGLIIAQALLAAFPNEAEGQLAPRLNALVRKETLAEIGSGLDIGAHMQMARSEAMTGGRKKQALIADAMEALIAAVYLDGGLEAARHMVSTLWQDRVSAETAAPIDAKTALQEWAQAHGLALPLYRLIERTGPDHAPIFTVEAALSDGRSAKATDAPKRTAEQKAAAALLARITT